MSRSKLHEAALAYAREGFPVFPCLEGRKEPATERGFKDATTDARQIDAWWADNPQYNIGFSPGSRGWVVVDPDGAEGILEWQDLLDGVYESETFTVQTPRGGWHVYFEGTLPKQSKLAPHVDTRTGAGYVLIPPSRTEAGEYKVLVNADVQPLPAWVKARVRPATAPVTVAPEGVVIDDPENVALAVAYLKRLPFFRVGAGDESDLNAYRAATKLSRDWAISDDLTCALMLEYFPCEEKDDDWIETKVRSALRSGQNAVGARARRPTEAAFGEAIKALLPTLPKLKRSIFYPLTASEVDAEPDPEWLIPNLIPDKASTWWVAAPKSFKSAVCHDLMLCVATGEQTIFGVAPRRRGHVFYCILEGKSEHKLWRHAWQAAHNVSTVTLDRYFHVMRAPMLAADEQIAEFHAQIEQFLADQGWSREPVALVVVDTQSKVMAGLEEASSRDASTYINWCDRTVERHGAAFISIHHEGKDASKGGRGSSAFPAGFATGITLNRPREHEPYVSVKVNWHKMGPEPKRPWYFEGKQIGKGLVFEAMTPAEWFTMLDGSDPLGEGAVIAALKALGAIGTAKGVTTSVLASRLLNRLEGEDQDDWNKRCHETSKRLNKLARDKLSGYVIDGVWCLLGETERSQTPET